LMNKVKYDFAYMFFYSERPKTLAERKYEDDIPADVKIRRLNEVIATQNRLSRESNAKDIGKVFEVLVENTSKRSVEDFSGRNSQNKVVVFPREDYQAGDIVEVLIESSTSATLIGKAVRLIQAYNS